jgi:uncharacterized delta-60 repeat protein
MTLRKGRRLDTLHANRRLGFELLENRQLLSATPSLDLASALPLPLRRWPNPDESGIPQQITVAPEIGADQAIAIEPDGKIVVVHGDGLKTTMNVYNPDGTPDADFGNEGVVDNVFGTNQSNAVAAIALQSDGKIVVVGWTTDQNLKSSFALVRFNADGSRDNSFGNLGLVVTSVDRGDDLPTSLAIQPDGKIVVGGAAGSSLPWSWNPDYHGIHPDVMSSPRYSPILLRYNPDGSLDSSFNGTGIDEFFYDDYPSLGSSRPVPPNPLPLNDAGSINQVRIQADGKLIVAAGPLISRINSDGTLDKTFGQGGAVTVPLPLFPDQINSLAIQPDGKLLVAANGYAGVNEFALYIVRYNADGSLDTTFNHGQPASTPVTPSGWGQLTDLEIGSDGKIVATANVEYVGIQSYGVVARFDSDGTLDTSFGGTGQVSEHDYGWNVAVVQADGKVVMVGGGLEATSEFHVKRFNADGTEDVGFNDNLSSPATSFVSIAGLPGVAPPKADLPETTVAPIVTNADAPPSVSANAVPQAVDSVPSIDTVSFSLAVNRLAATTADLQMTGVLPVVRPTADPALLDITAAATLPASTTILLIAPDDAIAAAAPDDDAADKSADGSLLG